MDTIPKMFWYVTEQHRTVGRPAYMYKRDGRYVGITHTQLQQDVLALAAALCDVGIEPGDRIGLVSENRYEWVLSDFATLMVGGVDVPMFPTLTAKQIAYILNHSQAVGCAVSSGLQLGKLLSVVDELETVEFIITFDEVPPPADVKLPVYHLCHLLERGMQKLQGVDVAAFARELLERTQPDDLCTIIYTSGTTGTPKGVMLTHRNILSNVAAVRQVIEVSERDVFLSYLPMCHAYERTTGYYTAFASGGMTAFAESIDTVRTNLQEVRPTIMTSVPQLFERVRSGIYARIAQAPKARQKIFHWAVAVGLRRIEEQEQGKASLATELQYRVADRLVFAKIRQAVGGRLRFFVSGGGPLSPEVNKFFWAIGLPILEGYGLTEAAPVLTVNRLDDNEFGTVGKPLPGIEIRIDETGEILARGPNIMRGYWRDPEATREAIDAEGWLHTGDVGCWTARGNLKITDRIKNIIVTSGGKNVAPAAVEAALLASPLVQQVVVAGDGRPYCVALIVPVEEALRALARERGISSEAPLAELCRNEHVVAAVQQHLERYQRDLAKYERVRRIALLPEPFTVENGLLTPTLKPRRRLILERYSSLIEQLYSDV